MRKWANVSVCALLLGGLLAGCENTNSSQNQEELVELDHEDVITEPAPIEYAGQGTDMIHINQLGYRPSDQKIAVINSQKYTMNAFQVIDVNSKEIVLSGELTGKSGVIGEGAEPRIDIASGDFVYWADFSSVNKPGTYLVEIPEYGQSYPFVIADRPYMEVKNALLKALYYQRCGTALEETHAGEYAHGVCHADLARLYDHPDMRIDVSGGWHDAGDYGRYVVPAANTVAYLLASYEMFPGSYEESLNIPESGNGVGDLLNEARYELDWLLKMQDKKTGGAYHKVAAKNFEGFVMPENDRSDLYVLPVSPTATGDLAAIMAMASRVYAPIDARFADTALNAAKRAWEWIEANPNAAGYKNPQDVVTGEYGDNSFRDETFWAAVELYRTTGEERYHEAVKSLYKGVGKTGLGWGDVSGFGTISYLFMDDSKQDSVVAGDLKKAWIQEADQRASRAKSDGYGITMSNNDYGWGSNMGVMNQAIILIIADQLKPTDMYAQSAHNLFHYLLGRNALDQSYVTGFGSKPVMHPHHRPSGSDGIEAPIPGLVSGGPNRNRQDPTAEAKLPSNIFPSRAFVDDQGSWSTNEIAIYWNGPAVFVAGYLDQQ